MFQQHPAVIVELALVLSSTFLLQNAPQCNTESPAGWSPSEDSWNYWWSYTGVSGPTYWGLLNLDWFMCDKGRRQSPINIDTSSLVYDPRLAPLRADNNLISGFLHNDGHAIVFNGTIPSGFLVLANGKTSLDHGTTNGMRHNGSISKRRRRREQQQQQTVGYDEIFSLGSKASAHSALDNESSENRPDSSSAAVLRELSNSVELSISQNDRLEIAQAPEGADSLEKPDGSELSDPANSAAQAGDATEQTKIQFTGAGLAYAYRFELLYLRFSLDSKLGSEHQINSKSYAAELQLMAYNSLLYKSYAEAATKPQGLLAIAVLVDVLRQNRSTTISGGGPSQALELLLAQLPELQHRGASVLVRNFNLSALLPETDHFVAYEGSLTTPGCHESVNWLVLNRPLYITQSDLDRLRSVSADEQSSASTGTLIAGNTRPLQPVGDRPIRTNIKPPGSDEAGRSCQRLWTRYEYRG